jgi:hypothetical protein
MTYSPSLQHGDVDDADKVPTCPECGECWLCGFEELLRGE